MLVESVIFFSSYPGDRFNRFWEAHSDGMPVVESQASVSQAAFWNKPPEDVFRRGVTTAGGRGESLELQWPPAPLPAASYYLALYFQDNRAPGPLSWRVFDVAVNGETFFAGLNVSTAGSMLYGDKWPLSGRTKITLTPAPGSPVGPVINAAELMMVVPLGGRTHPRDGNLTKSHGSCRIRGLLIEIYSCLIVSCCCSDRHAGASQRFRQPTG